jgi:two-component system, OmpR family, response regulator
VNRKPSVLVLEKDPQIRELLERWLGEAGYLVSATVAGPPSLVIVDLPSSQGGQAVIQSLQEVYAAPVLVLSGRFRRGLAESADAARRLGVKRVLPIPFTRKELLAAVDASLGGKR